MGKRLSVIIPTYNRRHVLERTLPALSAQDLPREEYEVIVLVDGSTDGTVELLRAWRPDYAFRVLEATHRGPSASRNTGIRAAVGDLILFLDDDLIAIPNLLRQHCEAHFGSQPRVVHGPIYIADGSSQTIIRHVVENFYRSYYHSLNPEMELHYPEGLASSMSVLSSLANSSMSRDVLLRSGGFDEQILTAEDLELGIRLWKMGASFRFMPTAIAYEYYVKSSREYLSGQAESLGAGELRVSRKHPEYRPYSRMSPFAEASVPKRWLRSALMGPPLSLVPLIFPPLRFEKWIYRWTPLRRLFVHFFRIAERITRLRGALDAAGSWNNLRNEFDRQAPALLYHHVGPQLPGDLQAISVSPQHFERQMRWLARRGYTGITAIDWLRWRRNGSGLPEKPIIITFDDAYADTAECALPILRRYGFGAVIFVVTGLVGGTNCWDEARGSSTRRLMTAEQIRYWSRQGIEFGAHSRTHADLSRLSASDIATEVVGSKKDLSSLLGSPPICFAYPYGAYNEVVRDLVQSEFDLAFGVDEGINYLRSDPHGMRRIHIGPTTSVLEFALCVHRGKIKQFRDLRARLALRSRFRSLLGQITGRFSHQG